MGSTLLLVVVIVVVLGFDFTNGFHDTANAWSLGLPSSSTHALIGGLVGAAWVAGGKEALIAPVGGVGVVGVYGLVVIGATRYLEARRSGRDGRAAAALSLAVLSAAVCLGAVAIGIIAMTHTSS